VAKEQKEAEQKIKSKVALELKTDQEGAIYSAPFVILLALIILFVGLILLKLFSHFSLIP